MLGEIIKKNRIEKGLSCYALAKSSGHPVSSIHGIETGINQNPRFEIICDISDVLGISVEVLKKEFQKDRNKKEQDG